MRRGAVAGRILAEGAVKLEQRRAFGQMTPPLPRLQTRGGVPRASLRAGIAVAAVAPVLFLLTNRIFSPQYLVLILAAWAIAGALVVEGRREQLALGAAAMAATTANAFVYPYTLFELGLWRLSSALLFAVGLGTSAWILARALRVSHAVGTRRAEVAAEPGLFAGLARGDR